MIYFIKYAMDSLKSNPNQTINIHFHLTFDIDKKTSRISMIKRIDLSESNY